MIGPIVFLRPLGLRLILVIVSLVAVVAAGLRLRSRADDRLGWSLVVAATVAILAADLMDAGVVTGLVPATPALVLAALLVTRADLARPAQRLLLGIAALFALAVLATQYADGGGLQWGGRFFHLALPFVVPMAAMVLTRAMGAPDSPAARAEPGRASAVWALVAVTAVMALAALGLLRTRSGSSVDSVEAALDAANASGSADAVLVFDGDNLGRMGWDLVLDRPSLRVDRRDWPDAADRLTAAGAHHLLVASTAPLDAVTEGFPGFEVVSSDVNDAGTLRISELERS